MKPIKSSFVLPVFSFFYCFKASEVIDFLDYRVLELCEINLAETCQLETKTIKGLSSSYLTQSSEFFYDEIKYA
jgi:hypothetical protein